MGSKKVNTHKIKKGNAICECCGKQNKNLIKADNDGNKLCKDCFKEFKDSGAGYVY